MKYLIFFCSLFILFCSPAFAEYSMTSYGGFVTNVTTPVLCTEVDTTELKSATGSYTSVFLFPYISQWLFSYGDAGIQNISQKAGITNIKYVDESTTSIVLFFRWFEQKSYKVYGT